MQAVKVVYKEGTIHLLTPLVGVSRFFCPLFKTWRGSSIEWSVK